jgi:homoserine dehydrogenase
VSEKVIVLKFGSSVLRNDADLPNAVHEIYRWGRIGYRVIAVVSAIGNETDRLLAQSRGLSSNPEPFATAELLATGERASAALLGVALDRAGLLARVLNPREFGLTVLGPPLDSELMSTDVERLRALLIDYPVLIVPGFFGTDVAGRTHLLGRGGSDLTAVFLAHVLAARCRLIKDVDGVYESDPEDAKAHPRRFTQLNYIEALRVAGRLVQPKAVSYLKEHGTCAEVAAPFRSHESTVHAGTTQLTGAGATAVSTPPLKILLLGLGTVGYGVYHRLLANPEHFEVAGCLVRDRMKYRQLQFPDNLLHTDAKRIFEVRPDIIVDALAGLEPALDLVQQALRAGISVVSANKTLIAEHGAVLATVAREFGLALRHSAAVGGSTPMIEAVTEGAKRPIVRMAAVLNGTCNFVLDACGAGSTLEQAIAEAQAQGFAETDATEDLSGRDAERKLRILSRHAFGAGLDSIEVQGLDEAAAGRAQEAVRLGRRLRHIARASRDGGRLHAQVCLETVEADSLFGRLSREWNALEIVDTRGQRKCVVGRGAGRWPTTEAVLADLFDVHRYRSAGPSSEHSR